MSNSRLIAVIGAGPCGLAVAIGLHLTGHSVTVYELRDGPSAIGGSINLMPNAISLLDDLGVDTTNLGCESPAMEVYSYQYGGKISEMPTRIGDRMARRVLRGDVQGFLLKRCKDLGVKVVFGSRLTDIIDEPDAPKVKANFEGKGGISVDLILGCDGSHSAVRTKHVEPERQLIYDGITAVQTVIPRSQFKTEIPFVTSGVWMGRRGNLIICYCDAEKQKIYFASVANIEEAKGKEGWKARGAEHENTMADIKERFQHGVSPFANEIVELADKQGDLFHYPIYSLPPWGKWWKGRVLLLGDAAHAMPPQGESTGYAIEDAVLFVRVLKELSGKPTDEIFASYDQTRRKRIEDGWIEAHKRSANHKEKGWFASLLMEWFGWLLFQMMRGGWEKSIAYDVRKEPILK